jgi:hypothetical protein
LAKMRRVGLEPIERRHHRRKDSGEQDCHFPNEPRRP